MSVMDVGPEEAAKIRDERRSFKRGEAFGRIRHELEKAYAKHSSEQWGRHEFYGILKEEFNELEEAIFEDQPMERIVAELVQVAAVCVRYYETGDRRGWQ